MKFATVNSASSTSGLAGTLVHFTGRMVRDCSAKVVYFKTRRDTQKQLSGLSDQLLRDIGLTRGEISEFSHRAATNASLDQRFQKM